jgi:hypothetical protein
MNWLAYILLGRLFILLGQKFPLPTFLERNKKIKEWHECSLCFGVWVYAAFSYVLGVDILQILGISYIPLVAEFVTGGVVSFIVFIFGIGWKDYFSPDIVI